MTIKRVGKLSIPKFILECAEKIKHENYKVNTPKKFQKHQEVSEEMLDALSFVTGIPEDKLDWVYFSVAQGAEPHTDELDPKVFSNITYVIPVILPPGKNVIHHGDMSVEAELGHVYRFDHTVVHSMTVEDKDSGCVVIMASELI